MTETGLRTSCVQSLNITSKVTHTNESCHTHERVMSQWQRHREALGKNPITLYMHKSRWWHVEQARESCHTFKCVMSHIQMRHVNESLTNTAVKSQEAIRLEVPVQVPANHPRRSAMRRHRRHLSQRLFYQTCRMMCVCVCVCVCMCVCVHVRKRLVCQACSFLSIRQPCQIINPPIFAQCPPPSAKKPGWQAAASANVPRRRAPI